MIIIAAARRYKVPESAIWLSNLDRQRQSAEMNWTGNGKMKEESKNTVPCPEK